ncbi:MAG: SRPBCC family protein [Acidimicrobiia bacterium]|nr:SRPBCC family protein [Acidimicrobiia bacterium]
MNHSVDIDLPVRTVYDQWTQFEDFPLFMKHVKDVRQTDETTLEWTAKISGIKRSWTAEITEQTPDQRIAWHSVDGTKHGGVVTFHALSDDTTRVMVQLDVDPEGFLEKVADWGGYVSDRSKKDLEQFKDFIESRGRATGAWRGDVERDSMHDLHSREESLRDLSDAELAARAEACGVERPLDRPRDWIVSAVAHQEHEEHTVS